MRVNLKMHLKKVVTQVNNDFYLRNDLLEEGLAKPVSYLN